MTEKKVKSKLKKRMTIAIISLIVVIGIGLGWPFILRVFIFGKIFAHTPQAIAYVSTVKASRQDFKNHLSAVGTLTALHMVSVASQVSGKVLAIYFHSGQDVKKGQAILQLDDATDKQALANLSAQYAYAVKYYDRMRRASIAGGVSKDAIDQQKSKVSSLNAQVNQAQVTIAQKRILAPFSGKIGLRQVDVGQYLSPGSEIAKLVAWDPLLVQFSLPEQDINSISVGQSVRVSADAYPQQVFHGKITAIDSAVDSQTHTISLRATVPNKQRKIYPGSYATVDVMLPKVDNVVTVPKTAVVPSLYGDMVYVLTKGGINKRDNKPYQIAKQKFVKLGDTIGNKIIIVSGVSSGETVVSVGQLKLQNNSRVRVNNTIK